jgi:aerobic carbon-monoxide dehydrogenase medium subunit
MEFHEPRSVSEALALVAGKSETTFLAGGASLVAMMNAKLVEPDELISLRRIDELTGIGSGDDGSLHMGAMTTHEEIAGHNGFQGGQSVISQAAARIGHPAIRAMGTIGGAVGLADPAADYPPALVAANARINIAGSAGNRSVSAEEFFKGYFETALNEGEIITGVSLPPAPPNSAASFVKFARVEGDYATVSVAAVIAFEGDSCRQARIVVGACGPVPTRVPEAEAGLVGAPLEPAKLEAAGRMIAAKCRPVDDVRGTAGYRRKIIPELIQRAVHDARSRIETAP